MQQYEPYTICTHYISALVNGDYSGLDDDDTRLVNDWVDSLPDYHTIQCSESEPDFRRDDISGLMADCIDVYIWTYLNKANS